MRYAMKNCDTEAILENQLPNSLHQNLEDLDLLACIKKYELFYPFIRLYHRNGTYLSVWLNKIPSQPGIYSGQYSTPECTGLIKIFLEQASVDMGFFPIKGRLEIEHQSGYFSGNIELCFRFAGINLNQVKQWLIPSFNYHGNPFGKGEYPHPQITQPLGVRVDRTAQPYILVQDHEFYCALGLLSDGPPEGAVSGLPASLNWETSSDGHFIICSVFYPYWEYGHDSKSDRIYYKKNEFKAAERGLLEWNGPSLLKLPFHLWFGGSTDAHFYARISWYVWIEAEKTRLEQQRLLYSEMIERIQFLNDVFYDEKLIPGHYRCNMAYPYAALGFIWCSLQAAYLDWWLESWGNQTLSKSLTRPTLGRGYRALKHWAEYGTAGGLLMTHYDGAKYSIGNDYNQEYINTRLLIEGVNTFLDCYILSEALEKPEPVFQRVVKNQLDWLLEHQLDDGTFARDYYRDGSPARKAPTATGMVIASLCKAYRILKDSVYHDAAIQGYQSYREKVILNEAYYGGTLDADTEDKEAGFFALDAAIGLFRMTGQPKYLEDAKRICDYILTYTWAYRIQTFSEDSMAVKNHVNTWGATSVSPENQHLDPYVNTAVILTGLFSNDPRYCELGLAMLYFALDGRWSIPQGEHCGRKQPEQFLNTNWFYNVESVVRRGNYRDIGEEWAWPQVVPCLEYLSVGGACLDLRTGKGIGIDGCKITTLEFSPNRTVILLQETMGCSHSVLLKLFHHPKRTLIVTGNAVSREIPWSQIEMGIRIDLMKGQELKLVIGG